MSSFYLFIVYFKGGSKLKNVFWICNNTQFHTEFKWLDIILYLRNENLPRQATPRF